MKSKLFLTVLLLAVITTIGISQEKQTYTLSADTPKTKAELEAELKRIYKLPLEVQSLAGVKDIYVLLAPLKEDAKYAGLTEEQLQTDVELKLRLAGIKVNTKEEFLASEDMAHVYVRCGTSSNKDIPSIPYTVSVSLGQTVQLRRSPNVSVSGTTWETGFVGLCPKGKFQEITRQVVKNQMDEFINDYLTANPKK